ncbi:MAG: FAD-binding oxidoreductase [Chloroflexi bacterium]|nr:MAG: FAD-binding oxidoreductase [Chloroflexota bacterium]
MAQRFLSNPSPAEWPRSADVIVIGGGPAGTATLWALERADPTIRTILLERSDRLGAGSSTVSLENYRTTWPALCLARQMQRGVEIFHNADEYLGEGAAEALAVKERGYFYCGFTESQAATLKADVEHLHAMGMSHVEYLERDEIAHRFAWVGERVIAAKYDPLAGWLDSNALIYRFAQSTRNATIILEVAETAIRVAGGRVVGVTTPHGDIDAPHVVIAAGAWSRAVGRTAGIDIPIIVRPVQSFTTSFRHAAYPEDGPMLIGGPPYPVSRPEARDGVIFGWEYHWNNKHVDDGSDELRDYLEEPVANLNQLKDPRFPSIVLLLMARQFGHSDGNGFDSPNYLRGLVHNIGYYVYRAPHNAYTIDADGTRRPYHSQRAIIGPSGEVDGLFLSVAHVGHGIMAAPASGEMMAAHILGHDLPDESFAQFSIDTHEVEFDGGGL